MPTYGQPNLLLGQPGRPDLGIRVWRRTATAVTAETLSGPVSDYIDDLGTGEFALNIAALPVLQTGDLDLTAVIYSTADPTDAMVTVVYASQAGADPDYSAPFALGQPGRPDLAIRVWEHTATAIIARSLPDSTITDLIVDLGTGEWCLNFQHLPVAVPGDLCLTAIVYSTADSTLPALMAISYGQPATVVDHVPVYSPELNIPTPFAFCQNDTYGQIWLQVMSGLPPEIAAASATFSLFMNSAGADVITAAAAVISDIDLTTDGTYGCVITYTLLPGDLSASDSGFGRFRITFPDGTTLELPAPAALRVRINPAI